MAGRAGKEKRDLKVPFVVLAHRERLAGLEQRERATGKLLPMSGIFLPIFVRHLPADSEIRHPPANPAGRCQTFQTGGKFNESRS